MPTGVQKFMLTSELQGTNVRSLGQQPKQQPCGPGKAIGVGHNTNLWVTHWTIGPANDEQF